MAQKKAHEVEGWLKRPPEDVRIVLFYGPDRGLVSERARRFADWTGLSLDDPFSVVRLDAAEIDREPGRLLDEARALSMFSQRRLVWVRGASNQKGLADQVATLAADPPPDTFVLVEAGDLKKGAALRAAVEPAAAAMALPCYADEGRTLDALIDAEMQAVGVTITLEARQALRQSLGGDRLATRGDPPRVGGAPAAQRVLDGTAPREEYGRARGGDRSGRRSPLFLDRSGHGLQ
jgi:DNA polymerase-3 subunit delta